MAPRQLRLELEEVDTAAEKGPKRVRADSTNEGSTQVRLHARATAWGITWHGLKLKLASVLGGKHGASASSSSGDGDDDEHGKKRGLNVEAEQRKCA
eukprot:scaffold25482_cov165-Isochrysis_galbana.AAC.1